MRTAVSAAVVTLVLGAGLARAQETTTPLRDFTNRPVERTVYATDQHMAFSIRTSLIRWLGGVSVQRDRDVRAAQKEGWWGEAVPQVPPGVVRVDR
jgi:hypothetical protein